MDPEKWRPVREQIEAARKRRDDNAVALATKTGVLIGTFLERNYPRAVGYAVDTRCNRVRILVEVELDLTTGEIEANLGLQAPVYLERASQASGQCPPSFQPG